MIALDQLPSFQEHRIDFPVQPNFIVTNASVAVRDSQIFVAVCCGDHFMDERGHYMPIPPGDPPDRHRFSEQNVWLADLDHRLRVKWASEIKIPDAEMPQLAGETYKGFRGFDSARLFVWHRELWLTMCAMGTGAKPEAALFIGRIDDGPAFANIRRVKPILPYPSHAEKNWMPEIIGDELRFHYHLGTLAALDGTLTHPGGRADLMQLHDGSQVIPHDGGGLCIAHGFHPRPDTFLRSYHHYFVRTNRAGSPVHVSDAWTIRGKHIEIVTGMAYHPNGRLMISYGREGAEETMPNQEFPFIATIDRTDLGRFL